MITVSTKTVYWVVIVSFTGIVLLAVHALNAYVAIADHYQQSFTTTTQASGVDS